MNNAVLLSALSIATPVLINKTYDFHKKHKLQKQYVKGLLVDSELRKKLLENYNKSEVKTNSLLLNENIEKMSKLFSIDDMIFLGNNIKDLKLKKLGIIKKNLLDSYYDIEDNYIVYEDDSLQHEFLHMASCFKKGDISLLGFRQYADEKCIGTGLNEGYTELLASRIKDKKPIYYLKETIVAQAIEIFVSEDVMKKLYFTSNLPELVKQLEKYMSNQDVIDLIYKIDMLHILLCNDDPSYYKYYLDIYNTLNEHLINSSKKEELKKIFDIKIKKKM